MPNDESIKKFRDWIVPLAEKKILPKVCIDAMAKTVQEMGKAETFRGYGPEHGYLFLREKIAVGDPVYPVYLDSNVMTGRMGNFNDGKFDGVTYLPCTEENNFSPVPLTFG